MRSNTYDEAVLVNALQVVRLLKQRSGDDIAWEQVESVLLSEKGSRNSTGTVPERSPIEGNSAERILCCCAHSSMVGRDSVVRYDDDRLQKALLYIHQHLDESIGVQDVAGEICVSRRWLEYAFRAAFGITPFQYLRCVRLELARLRLMNDPQSKVNQIALNTGFSSARQFTMTFRQYFGYSPSFCRTQQETSYSDAFASLAEAC